MSSTVRIRSTVSWITAAMVLVLAPACGHHAAMVVQNEPAGKAGATADADGPCMHGAAPEANGPCPHHAAMGERPCDAHGEAMPCADHGGAGPAGDGCCEKQGRALRWIDLATLAGSLPPPPIDVVFDVDDTILFTSPGFQWGVRTYGERIAKAGTPIREEDMASDEERRNFRDFWTKMNNELDQWSVKKWSGAELIKLHKARGDRIHFVTKRVKTGTEKLTELIAKTFDLKGMEPVIFTDRTSKTPFFRQVHAQVSYGDSDGDIRDSLAAGARPVRVQRARNSVNDDPTHDGAFGEEVLVDSAN